MNQGLTQQVRVRQACSLSPYLFSVFTGGIVDYTKEGNRHLKLVGKITTPELMSPDGIGVGWLTKGNRSNSKNFARIGA